MASKKCKINPYAEREKATSMMGFFTVDKWINDPSPPPHLDNACFACENAERMHINTPAKAALAMGVAYGGIGAIAMYKALREREETKLPECYGTLEGMKEFEGGWLGLTSIDSLMKVKGIEKIDVASNNMRSFPDISRLAKLKELDLTNNLIPPFECGTLKVKNANKKFHGKDLAAIQSCMASGRVLQYGTK